MTARARIGWVKSKECRELLNSKRFLLKTKGMVYQSCLRLAMLYGSDTWCLRENEMAILRRTKRAMMSNVWCKTDGEKADRGPSGLDGKGEWSEMVQCGHVLRRGDGHVLRKALEFEVKGKRKQG